MADSLMQKLGLDAKRTPLPPKFIPKVTLRITDGRSKKLYEFDVAIPVDGFCGDAYEQCIQKLHLIFEQMGLLKSRPKEINHGEVNEEKTSEENQGEALKQGEGEAQDEASA